MNKKNDRDIYEQPKKVAKIVGVGNSTINFSQKTLQMLQEIRDNTSSSSLEEVILKLIEYDDFSVFAQKNIVRDQNRYLIKNLPYSIRFYIIDFLKVELKYLVRSNNVVKSFQKKRNLAVGETIRELFGYFEEDITRKVFLIFKRLAIKSDIFCLQKFKCVIPLNGCVNSLRLYSGRVLENDVNVFVSFFPKCFCNKSYGIKCLILNSVFIYNFKVIINFIDKMKNLRRCKMSGINFMNCHENLLLELFKKLSELKSVTILSAIGEINKFVYVFFESENTMKLALGNNNLSLNPVLWETKKNSNIQNQKLKYLFIQNNLKFSPEINFNRYCELSVINVSHTSLSVKKLIELLNHCNIRKIVANNCDFNINNTVVELINGFKMLKESKLEVLNVNKSRFSNEFLKLLGKCVNITTLYIAKTGLDDKKLDIINIENFSRLEQLNIAWNGSLTLKSFVKLLSIKTIKKLVTPQNLLAKEVLLLILGSKSLQSISVRSKFSNPFVNEVLMVLKENMNLKYLNITKQSLQKEIIWFLKFKCNNIKILKYTDLKGKDITWERCEF